MNKFWHTPIRWSTRYKDTAELFGNDPVAMLKIWQPMIDSYNMARNLDKELSRCE